MSDSKQHKAEQVKIANTEPVPANAEPVPAKENQKPGESKASKEWEKKKQNCEEIKSQIDSEKENKEPNKDALDKLEKKLKDLACGQFLNEHADSHKELHNTLHEEHETEKSRHTLAVHDAIKKEIDIGGILKIFSETIKKRSDIAMKKVLLKSDHLIDIVVATLEEKIKTSGVPAIMGIELVTGIISFIIDIIPIPEIGILATAVEGAGDVVIKLISAVGPDSIIKTVEDSFLPIIEKIAVIFQGMAGSFSCCDKDKRQDKIKLSSTDKSELLESFKQLLIAVKKLNSEVEGEEKKGDINDAITKLNAAIEFLEKQGNKRGGGVRRRTRRRRHHKTKRKLFQGHKSHKKKKNHKKRTKKR